MNWSDSDDYVVFELTETMHRGSMYIIDSSWKHMEKMPLVNGYYTVLTLSSHPGKGLKIIYEED